MQTTPKERKVYTHSQSFLFIIIIMIGSFRSVFFVWIDLVYALCCTVDLFDCCV
jgi:hypothetical protein